MKTRNMLDDYRILCKEAEQIGKFEAYQAYTRKYPVFFQGVFQYLYCQPIENLKPMIEQVDFTALLKTAQENIRSGLAEYCSECAHAFAERMGADFPFTFLLGLELSNIGGCATPSHLGEPYLYIGLDRPLTREWIDLFIPHEMFHLVRSHITRDNAPETVFSRTIEEGLASYAPLWIHNMAWSRENVAKTLHVSDKQAENLMSHTEQLLNQLVADGHKPITQETMNAYFTAQEADVDFPVIGYYIGLYLTHLSVANGTRFERFVSMSRDEIIAAWFQ